MPNAKMGGGGSRLKRIIHMIAMFDSAQPRKPAQIAQALGVSKRTVYRDLAVLQECGLPALFDNAAHGYTLASPVTCRLKVDELLCLLIAVHAIAVHAAPSFRRLLRKASGKLARLLPTRDRKALRKLTKIFGEPIRESPRRQEDHLLTILQAVERKKALRVDYENCSSGTETGTLHILGLRTSDVHWEVIGKFEGERHYRRISLNRIRAAETII